MWYSPEVVVVSLINQNVTMFYLLPARVMMLDLKTRERQFHVSVLPAASFYKHPEICKGYNCLHLSRTKTNVTEEFDCFPQT